MQNTATRLCLSWPLTPLHSSLRQCCYCCFFSLLIKSDRFPPTRFYITYSSKTPYNQYRRCRHGNIAILAGPGVEVIYKRSRCDLQRLQPHLRILIQEHFTTQIAVLLISLGVLIDRNMTLDAIGATHALDAARACDRWNNLVDTPAVIV